MRRYDHIEEINKSDYDTIVEIEKFNPYHDARGRFSSADGATSFTYAPGKSKAHDMAIAREKERHAKQLANPLNDPETIAGVKRGPAMTHEQADEGRANPGYHNADDAYSKFTEANKKLTDAIRNGAPDAEKEMLKKELNNRAEEYNRVYEQTRPYRTNCQSCVVAYEARRRGYDVEAKPRGNMNLTQDKLAKNADIAWNNPKTGLYADQIFNTPNIRTSKQATNWLDQNIQEGARYAMGHGWKGTNGAKGHVITATKENGKLKFFDPQSGKSYEGDSLTEYMSRVKSTFNNGVELRGRLYLIRMDNAQINADVANAVLKGAGR